MSNKYSGWKGVKQLAAEYGLDWYNVCDLIYSKYHPKKPTDHQIMIGAIIYKGLQLVKQDKFFFDKHKKNFKRTIKETDIHYVIRANKSLIMKDYKYKLRGNDKFNFMKSINELYNRKLKVKYLYDIKRNAEMLDLSVFIDI
jgi:hypothetical protein